MNQKDFRKKQLRGARIADCIEMIEDLEQSTIEKIENGEGNLEERLRTIEVILYIIRLHFREYPWDGDAE